MGYESALSMFMDGIVYGLGYGSIVFLIGLTCGELLKYLSKVSKV